MAQDQWQQENRERDQDFTCRYCGEEFTDREELDSHTREAHAEESRSAGTTGTPRSEERSGQRRGSTTGTTGGRAGQQPQRSTSPRREDR